MVDCTKKVFDLTPYEAWECFWQADDWRIIGNNSRRMWADFTNTTIGEWSEIVIGLVLLPAQFASYLLPFVFISRLLRRYVGKVPLVSGEKERLRKTR